MAAIDTHQNILSTLRPIYSAPNGTHTRCLGAESVYTYSVLRPSQSYSILVCVAPIYIYYVVTRAKVNITLEKACYMIETLLYNKMARACNRNLTKDNDQCLSRRAKIEVRKL